jgi:hypothetical protein
VLSPLVILVASQHVACPQIRGGLGLHSSEPQALSELMRAAVSVVSLHFALHDSISDQLCCLLVCGLAALSGDCEACVLCTAGAPRTGGRRAAPEGEQRCTACSPWSFSPPTLKTPPCFVVLTGGLVVEESRTQTPEAVCGGAASTRNTGQNKGIQVAMHAPERIPSGRSPPASDGSTSQRRGDCRRWLALAQLVRELTLHSLTH